MPDQPQDLAPGLLRREWEHLSAIERRVMDHVVHRKPIARNTDHEFSETRSIGDRMSDRIAAFGGSWPFVLGFVACLVGWVLLNSWILRRGSPFDPYPYILLNLVLSTVAALQAPVILMAQNRHTAKDRLAASLDYEVNLKAEIEVQGLHEKLDDLRERGWAELVEMQRRQIALLERLVDARSEAGAPGEM